LTGAAHERPAACQYQPVLTTQLYFPDEPANARDDIFRPELVVRVIEQPTRTALFDAVLDII